MLVSTTINKQNFDIHDKHYKILDQYLLSAVRNLQTNKSSNKFKLNISPPKEINAVDANKLFEDLFRIINSSEIPYDNRKYVTDVLKNGKQHFLDPLF